MPPRRIIVTNSKGGTGKSTLTANSGHGLARKGKKVLLVDIDTQNQLAAFFGAKNDFGVSECVLNSLPLEGFITEIRPNLFLLPAGARISKANASLQKNYSFLKNLITPVEDGYDFIIFDAPPSWDVLVLNALLYCNEVWVPVATDPASFHGSCTFFDRFQTVRKSNKQIEIDYVIPIRADSRVGITQVILEKMKRKFGDKVTEPIRYSSKIMMSFEEGKTIFECFRWSQGRRDFNRFVDLILTKSVK